MDTPGVTDVKAYLNITSDASEDELRAVLAAAVAVVENVVGPLEPKQVTSRVCVTYGRGAVLPRYPVLALLSATQGGTTVDLTDVTVDSSGVVWDLPGGDYLITYTVGRIIVPADLSQAVKEMARHLWATQRGPTRRPGSAESSLSNTIPGAAHSLPIRVAQLLAPHHVPRVA